MLEISGKGNTGMKEIFTLFLILTSFMTWNSNPITANGYT